MTEAEAKKTLEEVGLGLEVKNQDEDNTENNSENTEESQEANIEETKVITEQLPKAGIKTKQGTTVIVYR